jgi:hypothetical protein
MLKMLRALRAHRYAVRWWNSDECKHKQSASCDRCGEKIKRGEGYSVETMFGGQLGQRLRFLGGEESPKQKEVLKEISGFYAKLGSTSDLICRKCFYMEDRKPAP